MMVFTDWSLFTPGTRPDELLWGSDIFFGYLRGSEIYEAKIWGSENIYLEIRGSENVEMSNKMSKLFTCDLFKLFKMLLTSAF